MPKSVLLLEKISMLLLLSNGLTNIFIDKQFIKSLEKVKSEDSFISFLVPNGPFGAR